SSRAAQVVPLMALSKVEGLRCLRSLLSFDLEAFRPLAQGRGAHDRLAAYYLYASVVVHRRLASNALLVPGVEPKSMVITADR
ncbi:hypothetical protein ACFL0H_09155, partial [Thermodesulfobacteriota bacterium]